MNCVLPLRTTDTQGCAVDRKRPRAERNAIPARNRCGPEWAAMTSRNTSTRQRLYEAATRWSFDQGVDNAFLIDAATDALVSGVDSPTLRELAGAARHRDTEELRGLLDTALRELMLPRPRGIALSDVVADDGTVVPRTPAETVRFEVAAADAYDGFQVLVFVDDVEMTSRAAGVGMGPGSLFAHGRRARNDGHARDDVSARWTQRRDGRGCVARADERTDGGFRTDRDRVTPLADRGEGWRFRSPDLCHKDHDGATPRRSITQSL